MEKTTCVCIDLRTAANRITRIYDDELAPSGITTPQFSLLHQIGTLQGPTLKELAAASQLERSTLGRNIRVLEKMGLIIMKAGDDARTRTIHLTRKGKNAFKRAVPLWQNVQSQMLDRLGQGGKSALDNVLQALVAPIANH